MTDPIQVLRDHERSQWAIVSAQAPHPERIQSARAFDAALAQVEALVQAARKIWPDREQNTEAEARALHDALAPFKENP